MVAWGWNWGLVRDTLHPFSCTLALLISCWYSFLSSPYRFSVQFVMALNKWHFQGAICDTHLLPFSPACFYLSVLEVFVWHTKSRQNWKYPGKQTRQHSRTGHWDQWEYLHLFFPTLLKHWAHLSRLGSGVYKSDQQDPLTLFPRPTSWSGSLLVLCVSHPCTHTLYTTPRGTAYRTDIQQLTCISLLNERIVYMWSPSCQW